MIPGEELGLGEIRGLMRRCGFRARAFVVPTFLGLLASFFEGAIIALLVPFTTGLLRLDFRFVHRIRGLRSLAQLPLGSSSNETAFSVLVALIFLAAILKSMFEYFSMVTAARRITAFTDRMRQNIFSRYLDFGKLVFDRTNMAHLHTVLMGHTAAIGRELMDLQSVVTLTFIMLAYLVAMVSLSPRLTAVVLIVFPALHFSLTWAIERIKAASKAQGTSRATIDLRIFNTLACILLVKSYTTENEERSRFEGLSGRLKRVDFEISVMRGLVGPVQELISLGTVLVLALSMTLFVKGDGTKTVPAFLVFFYILRRAMSSFGNWNKLRASISSVHGPLAEIYQIFNDSDKHFVADGARPFPGLKSQIEFNDLTFSYTPAVKALSHVSFSIEKGAMTAIVGPSGSGKTTLISLLLRFYDPPPGSIRLDGVDVRDFTLSSLRGRIALVSQDTLLLNDSIRNNIAYGRAQASDEAIMAAAESARLADFLARLPEGLDTMIGDRGIQLSGGERQRLSIARAILKNPEILILDEATSSLDSKTEQMIQGAIEELVKDRTSIVIAHRLSTIKNADRIVVLEDGQVAEYGGLAELLTRKRRFHLYWTAQAFA